MSESSGPNLVRLAHSIAREVAEARPVVEKLCGGFAALWEQEIPVEWRTLGFVQELARFSGETLERDPAIAADLARFAIAVVGGIPLDKYPSVLVDKAAGDAWIKLANAQRFRSNTAGALRALDSADRVLRGNAALDWDRAVSKLARAVVLSDVARSHEAAVVLDDALTTFTEYRDRRRQAQCFILRGMISHRADMFDDACIDYERAIAVLATTTDLQSLGSAYNNLADARAALNQFEAAVVALHSAVAIFTELGLISEIARTKGVLGALLLRCNKYSDARDMLTEARHMFLGLEMIEEAGYNGLLLVDAFIALGENFRAEAVVEEVLHDFIRAGLGDRARVALQYLRRMITNPRARDAARHVKVFVERLRTEPELQFLQLDLQGRE